MFRHIQLYIDSTLQYTNIAMEAMDHLVRWFIIIYPLNMVICFIAM